MNEREVDERPNILLIFTDQQALRAMSCAGNPYLYTPHLDALAAGGVRFEKSYCTSPVCGPSRASIVTGRMPHEVGANVNPDVADSSFPHVGELLQAAGYETAWAGKWHNLPYDAAADSLPGFEYLGISSGLNAKYGAVADAPFADEAVEFLRREHKRPFFLGVSLHNPHDICYEIIKISDGITPYDNLPPLENLPPLPSNFEVDADEPEFIGECRRRTYYGAELRRAQGWTEHQWRAYLDVYYRLTERADGEVGRVLDALRDQGLEDQTLVVFTSDHGEGMAAHRWAVKLMLWQEVVQVPFIVRPPGRSTPDQGTRNRSTRDRSTHGGVERDFLVTSLDIVPTICDYAGAVAPSALPGLSLRPLLEGAAHPERVVRPEREFVVAELQPDTEAPAKRGRMLCTNRFKYIVFSHGRNPEMLFDLEVDPGETRNLVPISSYAHELERHRCLLHEWCMQTNDTFASD